MTLSEAEKMNRITRVLRLICRDFDWNKYWSSTVSPFIMKNREKILALYDEIEEIVEEK